MPLPGPNWPIYEDMIIGVGGSLASTENGISETPLFQIEKRSIITSFQFSDKLDPCAFYFDYGEFPDSMLTVKPIKGNDCNSYIQNKASTNISATAKVACEENPETLEQLLLDTNLIEDVENPPTYVWPVDPVFDKVCVVILQRP